MLPRLVHSQSLLATTEEDTVPMEWKRWERIKPLEQQNPGSESQRPMFSGRFDHLDNVDKMWKYLEDYPDQGHYIVDFRHGARFFKEWLREERFHLTSPDPKFLETFRKILRFNRPNNTILFEFAVLYPDQFTQFASLFVTQLPAVALNVLIDTCCLLFLAMSPDLQLSTYIQEAYPNLLVKDVVLAKGLSIIALLESHNLITVSSPGPLTMETAFDALLSTQLVSDGNRAGYVLESMDHLKLPISDMTLHLVIFDIVTSGKMQSLWIETVGILNRFKCRGMDQQLWEEVFKATLRIKLRATKLKALRALVQIYENHNALGHIPCGMELVRAFIGSQPLVASELFIHIAKINAYLCVVDHAGFTVPLLVNLGTKYKRRTEVINNILVLVRPHINSSYFLFTGIVRLATLTKDTELAREIELNLTDLPNIRAERDSPALHCLLLNMYFALDEAATAVHLFWDICQRQEQLDQSIDGRFVNVFFVGTAKTFGIDKALEFAKSFGNKITEHGWIGFLRQAIKLDRDDAVGIALIHLQPLLSLPVIKREPSALQQPSWPTAASQKADRGRTNTSAKSARSRLILFNTILLWVIKREGVVSAYDKFETAFSDKGQFRFSHRPIAVLRTLLSAAELAEEWKVAYSVGTILIEKGVHVDRWPKITENYHTTLRLG